MNLNFKMSLDFYNKNKEDYKLNSCYDNSVMFVKNNIDFVKENIDEFRVVYGCLCSKDENTTSGIYHCWIENGNDIIDVTLLADGYNEENTNLSNFKYVPYKKYNMYKYMTSLRLDKNNYPDRQMINDINFRDEVEKLGYKIRG